MHRGSIDIEFVSFDYAIDMGLEVARIVVLIILRVTGLLLVVEQCRLPRGLKQIVVEIAVKVLDHSGYFEGCVVCGLLMHFLNLF